MSCANCGRWGEDSTDTRMACRVCELIDDDVSIKRVKWCSDCKAHICQECWNDIPRRVAAFAKNVVEKVVDAIQGKGTRRNKKNFPTDEFSKEDEGIAAPDKNNK